MPMSFASLLGGLVTLVGTSPNIIVSQVRQELFGKPFGMYDFAPVGLGLTALGVVFLAFAYRLLPTAASPAETMDAALAGNAYVTEVEVAGGLDARRSRAIGDLHGLAEGDVTVIALIRAGKRQASPHANTRVRPGDRLLLEGEQQALRTT